MAARRSAQPLYAVYLERVIKIEAVQCHRAAATDDYKTKFLFFTAGCRPKLAGHFQWSLDAPEEDFPGAAEAVGDASLGRGKFASPSSRCSKAAPSMATS